LKDRRVEVSVGGTRFAAYPDLASGMRRIRHEAMMGRRPLAMRVGDRWVTVVVVEEEGVVPYLQRANRAVGRCGGDNDEV